MYPYFFLKSIKVHIPRKLSQSLTFLQLLQMIVAVGINAYSQFVISEFDSNEWRHVIDDGAGLIDVYA